MSEDESKSESQEEAAPQDAAPQDMDVALNSLLGAINQEAPAEESAPSSSSETEEALSAPPESVVSPSSDPETEPPAVAPQEQEAQDEPSVSPTEGLSLEQLETAIDQAVSTAALAVSAMATEPSSERAISEEATPEETAEPLPQSLKLSDSAVEGARPRMRFTPLAS
ncbi:MAG TPA: hypothetical protein VLM37_12160, partial [Fibrobacteraceae bacterium]|nr:hypothetical protein [Fibrobacteraceae bacterium]